VNSHFLVGLNFTQFGSTQQPLSMVAVRKMDFQKMVKLPPVTGATIPLHTLRDLENDNDASYVRKNQTFQLETLTIFDLSRHRNKPSTSLPFQFFKSIF
jgi:hypothetical protein